ncbi:MAG: MBOAT family protein [Lentisphaerae bacterium]|nr:MBOAT family protein [Lentisphaerota bacterium]
MVFSSLTFLFYFLPATLLVYFLTPPRWRNLPALTASLVFFAWGAPRFVFVLIATCFADYHVSRWIVPGRLPPPRRRALLAAMLAVDLGLLVFFKYANFFAEQAWSFLDLFGLPPFPWRHIVLPIGISFFTFQKVSYLVDVYRGTAQPARSAGRHLLYISLFPQLIAGPIVRYHDVDRQLEHRTTTSGLFLDGLWRFCIGLAKKVLLANTFARMADAVFGAHPFDLTAPQAWAGLLAYSFQLYYDFAGYSDMAIGLGRMMGLRFLENFNFPYASAGIGEFWRRWHISLGRFMMEYLYIPLGGNRDGHRKTLRNLWLVFLASGIWHGANWTFVLWGIWHGTLISLEKHAGPARMERIPRALRITGTFLLVALGWVLFRAENPHHASRLFRILFGIRAGGEGLAVFPQLIADRSLWLAAAIGIPCAFAPVFRLDRWLPRDPADPDRMPLPSVVLRFLLSLLILAVTAGELCASGFNPFIYFQF